MLHLALAAHAPVDVDVSALGDDPGARRLHGDLLVRLLEEGWTIGSGDDAIVVRVESQGDGRVVHIEHGGVVVRREVEPGPGDAMYLELMHGALELVREVEPVPTPPPSSAASYEIEVADSGEDARSWDPDFVRAVVDAGGTVTSRGGAAWRLCIARADEGWSYRRVSGTRACDDAPPSLPSRSRDETLAAIADDVRSQATRASTGDDRETGVAVVEPAPISRREVADRRPPDAPFVWSNAGAGISTRGRQVEAAVPLAFGIAHASGFGGMLRAAMLIGPARGDLQVLDATIAAGPAFHRPLGSRLALGVAVLGGALLHRYRYGVGSPRTESAPEVELPVWATIRLVAGFTLGLGLDIGFVATRWDHVVGSRTVWARPAFRFGAGVTLGWCWGWS